MTELQARPEYSVCRVPLNCVVSEQFPRLTTTQDILKLYFGEILLLLLQPQFKAVTLSMFVTRQKLL